MLGERGIRAMQRLPELLDEQLTGILLAARQIPVRAMFPMITQPDAMAWGRTRLEELERRLGGHIDLGMMVETPAAAVRARDFLDLADFISVGTNDLTQYTLAVDRGNPQVAAIAKGDNNAVLDLIEMAATAFAGKPVAVCGDLASQPAVVPALLARGVTELSVRPPLVGVIKQVVRNSA
jgi:phosphocarrier protein FPr